MEVRVTVTNGTASASAEYEMVDSRLVLDESSFDPPVRFQDDWLVKEFCDCSLKGARDKARRETKNSPYGNVFSVEVL